MKNTNQPAIDRTHFVKANFCMNSEKIFAQLRNLQESITLTLEIQDEETVCCSPEGERRYHAFLGAKILLDNLVNEKLSLSKVYESLNKIF